MTLAMVLFMTLLALLLSHEMDAQARHEWRMMPGLKGLPDHTGGRVFLALHVPLFGVVLWACFGAPAIRALARSGLAGLAVLHVALHGLYRRHPANEFANPLSQTLIWGAGLAGVAYLLAVTA